MAKPAPAIDLFAPVTRSERETAPAEHLPEPDPTGEQEIIADFQARYRAAAEAENSEKTA